MELKDKIKKMTNAYGVSGDEFRVAEIAAELTRPYVTEVEIDQFGNVVGRLRCGKPDAPRILLDAHIDQIGFLVTEVTDDGYLRFVGMGVDQRMLPGSELTVLTREGPLLGIVGSTPPHLQKRGDQKKSVPISDMVVDIGMTGEEAKKRVRIGDYMAFANDCLELQGDTLCGKAMDDRACYACILHALELLQGKELPCDVIVTATTKEEQGGHGALRCAWEEKPDLAIAIDVCHARTLDNGPADSVHEFGGGPVVGIGSNSRPRLAKKVLEIARAKQIPYQVEEVPAGSGTNAWTMQVADSGYPTLVISLPLKYMHSPVEMLRMCDVTNVGRLLAEVCLAFDGTL